MKTFATSLMCLTLALASLDNVEAGRKTDKVRHLLTAKEHSAETLVNEVHAKGPEFEKCSTELVTETAKAFAKANATFDACQATAAVALATPPCRTRDVACRARIGAFKVKTMTDALHCMLAAVRSVDDVVDRLTTDILECDRRTGELHPALPAGRSRWTRFRDKFTDALGDAAIKVVTSG